MPKARLQYSETLYLKANIYREKGDYDNALRTFDETLSIAKILLKDKHPFWGRIYNDLALTYKKSGRNDDAIKYFNNALAATNKTHVNYATGMYNIARCHFDIEEYGLALPYAENALLLYKECLPPNHNDVKDVKNLLSDIKKHQGGNSK